MITTKNLLLKSAKRKMPFPLSIVVKRKIAM
jgi:hypothetical protein